jgi:hypothetical protein
MLLPLQLILAGLVQPLHLLKLTLYPCILGRGDPVTIQVAPLPPSVLQRRRGWIHPPLSYPASISSQSGRPKMDHSLTGLKLRPCRVSFFGSWGR